MSITHDELDEMSRIAETDPGMADLMAKLREYYLLKRPDPVANAQQPRWRTPRPPSGAYKKLSFTL